MTLLALVLRHWKLLAIALACLVLAGAVKLGVDRWRMHRDLAPVQADNTKALRSIDQVEKDSAQKDQAIQALSRQATELENQAVEARTRRQEAERQAQQARVTSAALEARLSALEASRRAIPKLSTLEQARAALTEALK